MSTSNILFLLVHQIVFPDSIWWGFNGAADFEEAYDLVERAVNELEKQVEDIAKKSSNVNLDNSVA